MESNNDSMQQSDPSVTCKLLEEKRDDVPVIVKPAKIEQFEEGDTEIELKDCNGCGVPLKCLNILRNPKWCLVFLSMAAFITGMGCTGLVSVVITTIEKRFGLISTQTGYIASAFNFPGLLLAIPVAYLGGRKGASKPHWIATGMLFIGAGSFVWSLPHFLTGPYQLQMEGNHTVNPSLCGVSLEEDGDKLEDVGCQDVSQVDSRLASFRFVFLVGQLLHGIGNILLLTLGITFLDESVPKKVAPLYIAIFQLMFVIGVAGGFVAGGQLLNIFTDPVANLDITPSSSLWVGAWWIGFLITAALATLLALPISCYPANLNKANLNKRKITKNKLSKAVSKLVRAGWLAELGQQSPSRAIAEQAKSELGNRKDENKTSLKALAQCVYRLITNPTYVLISIGKGINDIIPYGLGTFLPKYIENQFSMSNGAAAGLVGIIVVPAGAGGIFFGGWIIQKLNLTRTRIIIMTVLIHFTNIFFLGGFFLYCDTPLFAGINSNISSVSSPSTPDILSINFSAPFNFDCHCSTTESSPVCGSDNIMYLSPCLAGCSSSSSENVGNFTSCSCIQDIGTASSVRCSSECAATYIIPFSIMMFMAIFMVYMIETPALVSALKSVDLKDKSLAMGVYVTLLKLVGCIPGPIIFGFVFDNICLYWEPECAEGHACLLYDNNVMGPAIFGICVACKVGSIIFHTIAVLTSKRNKYGEKEEDANGVNHGEEENTNQDDDNEIEI